MGRLSLTQNKGEEEHMTWQQGWIIRTSWSTAADTLEQGQNNVRTEREGKTNDKQGNKKDHVCCPPKEAWS